MIFTMVLDLLQFVLGRAKAIFGLA